MFSDSEILKSLKVDKDKGIRVLFDRYYRPLVFYAEEYTDSIPVAEDIVQDFFVRLWEDDYLCSLVPRALSSYLFTSIRNACYTQGHRKDFLRHYVELSELDLTEECAAEMSRQIVDRVTEAIHKLPEKTSMVVMAILMYDKKYQEVADELHISLNTVKTLLKNGMKALRAELKHDRYLLLFIFFKKSFL